MSVAAAIPASSPRRGAMIAKVKIAQKDLGLDDGTYRAVLKRLTGKDSAAKCSEVELARVLDEFKAKGWTPSGNHRAPARSPGRKPADHPAAKKARALWISLHQLGAVREPSETALERFAARQLKVEALQWADQGQCYKLIEALKAMAERVGWSQDVSEAALVATLGAHRVLAVPGADIHALKVRLILAQWQRLADLGEITGAGRPALVGLGEWAHRRALTQCLMNPTQWSETALDGAAPVLGSWIRKALARRAA